MGNYFSQVANWLAPGWNTTNTTAPRDDAQQTRTAGAPGASIRREPSGVNDPSAGSGQSEGPVSASPEDVRGNLEMNLDVLNIVREGFRDFSGVDRRAIEVLGMVQENMGTYDRDHAGQGLQAEGSDENRATRRQFRNTEMARNIEQLRADLMAARRETAEALEAFQANPDNQDARDVWRAADRREATANGNYVNYGNNTPFWFDALRYSAATSANAQAYVRDADGLVGLRDLLQDYDDAIVTDDQLFQGIDDLAGQIERQLAQLPAADESGEETDGPAQSSLTNPFELAATHNSALAPLPRHREGDVGELSEVDTSSEFASLSEIDTSSEMDSLSEIDTSSEMGSLSEIDTSDDESMAASARPNP